MSPTGRITCFDAERTLRVMKRGIKGAVVKICRRSKRAQYRVLARGGDRKTIFTFSLFSTLLYREFWEMINNSEEVFFKVATCFFIIQAV